MTQAGRQDPLGGGPGDPGEPGGHWQWRGDQQHSRESWTPPMNVYQLPDRVELCLDLAGVDKRTIEVRVEPGRLVIRGYRHAPQPHRERPEGMRILRMEIDHGSFARVLSIPEAVNLSRVESEYRDGILWVKLPFGKERQEGT